MYRFDVIICRISDEQTFFLVPEICFEMIFMMHLKKINMNASAILVTHWQSDTLRMKWDYENPTHGTWHYCIFYNLYGKKRRIFIHV